MDRGGEGWGALGRCRRFPCRSPPCGRSMLGFRRPSRPPTKDQSAPTAVPTQASRADWGGLGRIGADWEPAMRAIICTGLATNSIARDSPGVSEPPLEGASRCIRFRLSPGEVIPLVREVLAPRTSARICANRKTSSHLGETTAIFDRLFVPGIGTKESVLRGRGGATLCSKKGCLNHPQ